ncbi:protein-glutamate methylesterase/protein-glutamine glutaminase [Phosphitispora fastidiosa]|uniref:protein-glutamate methylesterase/protein-glutamine glutaminase n=1 Tax=Phosphitispora fastidiosa TaxID=2837202 RepID=UPI001E2DB885|nr:chemotaxis response regulator protein-glutamate methylesterase [Phosphitispora fastidiosa]MBU7008288.1 two-component system chemotaxis response regulator CheB [Phosphitispora fastidiosa]
MSGRHRVLVVDDSSFMRRFITDILHSDDTLEVVATAVNGVEALKKVSELRPDVITLDIEMPEMDGLTALNEIMVKCPVPVIMLSNRTRVGAEATIKALELGALDFVAKPSGNISLDLDKVKDELILKVKAAARADIRSIRSAASQWNADYGRKVKIESQSAAGKTPLRIVAIGASTGGPRALQAVFSQLPQNLPAAIAVTQHMSPGFTESLAQRLNSISEFEVSEARDGDELIAGRALIAPGDRHMKIKRLDDRFYITLSDEPPVDGLRPSIDLMMDSLVECSVPLLGVLLTGMGQDGVAGLKKIRERNGCTIVEDESTCVIYGMPRAAIENRCVDIVAPIYRIAQEIMNNI